LIGFDSHFVSFFLPRQGDERCSRYIIGIHALACEPTKLKTGLGSIATIDERR
jgi:hypothetical protein